MTFPNGGEVVASGLPMDINWENPVGWMVHHADLYYSPDAGQTWEVIAQGVTGATVYNWTLPEEPTEDALIRVYLFDNQGVMGYDTSDGPFIVGESILGVGGPTPLVHALRQNAPNPFTSATRIAFDLPEQGHVDLRIYDVQGRLVRILKDNVVPAGSYDVFWDGRDDGGVSVASGIYFYHLRADKFSATKRMTVIK